MKGPEYVLEILHSMYAALVLPEHWTKGTSARDARGTKVVPMNPDAVRFCLSGAEFAAERTILQDEVASDRARDSVTLVLNAAIPPGNGRSMTYLGFNDRYATTHSDIVALLERAIIDQESLVYA